MEARNEESPEAATLGSQNGTRKITVDNFPQSAVSVNGAAEKPYRELQEELQAERDTFLLAEKKLAAVTAGESKLSEQIIDLYRRDYLHAKTRIAEIDSELRALLANGHGTDDLGEIENEAKPLVTFRRPSELIARPISWLVEQIIVAAMLTVLHACDKVGKTLLAWEIALAVLKKDLLFNTFSTMQGRVVLALLDDPHDLTVQRRDALGLTDCEDLRIVTPLDADLSDPMKFLAAFKKECESFGPQLIVRDAPRAGTQPTFTPLQRTQVVALACSSPRQYGKAWQRWSGEKLAQVAGAQGIGGAISPGTIRRWLRADKIKPWRYHSWQPSTDPQFVEKATPVLDLYAQAPALQAQGELTVCTDEKTSIQARQRVTPTKAAAPGEVMQVADRYKRMGALQLFCALVVASGLTFTQPRMTKKFIDFKAFLQAFFPSALCAGITVLHLLLDNGPTHAPKQLSTWLASLELAFEVRLYWLPKHASWLDQVEIIFSQLQRDLLMPRDFPSLAALEHNLATYFAELNTHPKPIKWTYTKTQLLAKFETPPPLQLAA